jgi:DNA-directed RNA polymerase specialized sigma24 family protein
MPLVESRILDQSYAGQPAIHPDAQAEVLRRAALLPEADRAIVHMSLKAGATRHMIGRALGLNPGTITRRLQRIGARLHDPLVIALLDRSCPLVDEYRQIGIEHFLQGLSTHAIGQKHRLSHDRVRRMLNAVRLWHDAGIRPTRCWDSAKSAQRAMHKMR